MREGLDIPEVSLVAILDADKEGFLRNITSLIQTFGRAARNVDGSVIMYASKITQSMKLAMAETERRKSRQLEYNKKMGITPATIVKAIPSQTIVLEETKHMSKHDLQTLAIEIEATMKRYAEDLDFENAIEYRDKLTKIQRQLRNE
ncbi:Excinuclease ABC subunit B [Candidatus Nitrosotalea sp. TS]|nr:Excinuclease ABC subunit B [Candidatus Nitrosotalea sp. TS]